MGIYKIPKVIGIGRRSPFGTRVNWNHPLSQGLVGVWLLNENCGSSIFNLINGFKGIITGDVPPPSWQSNDERLRINPNNNRIDFTNKPFNFDSSDPRTIAIDLAFDVGISGDMTIIGNLITASGYKGWEVYKDSAANGGKILFFVISSWDTNAFQAISNFVPVALKRYFLVVTYNGNLATSGVNFYVDGVLQTKTAPSVDVLSGSSVSTNVLRIGLRDNNSADWDGYLYKCYIWKRCLSYPEIRALYYDPYQMFWHPMRDIYIVPTAAPTGGKSIFGYDSIFHAGGIIQT